MFRTKSGRSKKILLHPDGHQLNLVFYEPDTKRHGNNDGFGKTYKNRTD
jgi:hypothetical protein